MSCQIARVVSRLGMLSALYGIFLLLGLSSAVSADKLSDSRLNEDLAAHFCSEEFKTLLLGFAAKSQSDEDMSAFQGWLDLINITQSNACIESSGKIEPLLLSLQQWQNTHNQHLALDYFPTLFNYFKPVVKISKVAVFLPQTGKFARHAHRIRQALEQQGRQLAIDLNFYDTSASDYSAYSAYQDAMQNNNQCVIGPLVKTQVNTLSQSVIISHKLPVLALNYLMPSLSSNDFLFQMSLQVELQGSALVKELFSAGYSRGILLYPKGDAYYQRLKESIEHLFYDFYGDWAVISSYKMNQMDYSDVIKKALKVNESEARNKQLSALLKKGYQFIPRRRQDVDFIVLLGNKKHLKLLYPQLAYWYASELPVYSTVRNQREFTAFDPDLNGLTLIKPPWSEDLALEFLGKSALELVLNSHCLQTLYLWERNKSIGWNLSAEKHQFFYKTIPIILKP